MKRFISIIALVLILSNTGFAVVFKNDSQNNSDRSAQLEEVAGTLRSIVQNILDVPGFAMQRPFSNQENQLVLNVFLYDINDGSSFAPFSARAYFSPFDQLKVDGNSRINEVSNFGNFIYLDIGLLDPTLGRPNSQAERTQAGLYANKFIFYQSFIEAFSNLIQFQVQNPYITDPTRIALGDILIDYVWLREALGAFLIFRGTRNLADVRGKLGVGSGLAVENNANEFIFNTCGAVIDFSTICESGPLNSLSSSLQSMPFAMVRFLHEHNSFTSISDEFIDVFPGLFHADLTPPIGTAATTEQETANEELDRSFALKDIAKSLGFLTFLYIWEQLEGNTLGAGDDFIKLVLASEVRSFTREGQLLTKKILTNDVCDRNGTIPVDKICAIDQALAKVQRTLPRDDVRSFSDYFLDMGSAVFLDLPASSQDTVNTFEFRNLNLPDLDTISSVEDAFLTTGNRLGVNFTRIIREPGQVGTGEGAVDTGGDTGGDPGADAGGDTGGDTGGDAGADTGGDTGADTGGDAGADTGEDTGGDGTGETGEGSDLDSENRLVLTTYSIAFLSLENRRNTADVSFPFLDDADLKDGDVDSDPFSVRSRRLEVGDSNSRSGSTTYIVRKAATGSVSKTSAVIFQALSDTGLSFQQRKAAFSMSKVLPVQAKPSQTLNDLRDPGRIFNAWKDILFRPIVHQRTSRASILETTGIKKFNDYQPLHEARESTDGIDPTAFREYTAKFKTLDLKQPTNLDALVFDQRTAILKEKIDGFAGSSGTFSILLWVDQVFLPESDSLTLPVTISEGLDQPLPVVVELPPKVETVRFPDSIVDSSVVLRRVTVPARIGMKVEVKNDYDTPITVEFSLPNRGIVSQRFELSDGVNTTKGKLRQVPILPSIFIARDSTSRVIEKIDQLNEVAPKTTKNFFISTKADNDEDLIISLSLSQLSPEVAEFSSSGGGGGGCFIATASFGSPNHPAVLSFCKWRDNTLLTTKLGRAFVGFYYKHSPPVADFLEKNPYLKVFVAGALIPVWWMVEGQWVNLFALLAIITLGMALSIVFLRSRAGV